jgi:anti-anti-sigma factor
LTTLRQDQTRALVRAVGEWDLAAADALAEELRAHETAGRRFVRLDVSAVTFLDCACLDVLVGAHARFLAARGTLVLSGMTPRILRLLRLTGLDRVLLTTSLSDVDVHPDRLSVASRSAAVQPA